VIDSAVPSMDRSFAGRYYPAAACSPDLRGWRHRPAAQIQHHKASRNDRYRTYFQDAWRIHPRFVLNYGVAYSYEDNLGNHDLDKPEYLRPVLGGAVADLRPTRRDPNNVNPVIGFAWGVDRSGKTVIRGGSGIYHDSNLFFARLGERLSIGPRGNGLALVNGQVIPKSRCRRHSPTGIHFFPPMSG